MRKDEDTIKKQNGGFGYVSFETFKNFVDKNNFIKEIETALNGEIFLNPDLNKIIKFAYENNIKLSAYNGVNLNYLTEETAENPVKYKFQVLNVSIDGATPETYSIYRRNGDFNKVIDNIKLINKYKKLYNSEYPKLIYKFIVFGHNEDEIEDAKKLAEELNMDILFRVNCYNDYSPVKNTKNIKKLTGLNYLQNRTMEEYNNKEKTKWFFCSDLFFNPYINFNGNLFGCCVSYKGSFRVNVFNEGLLKALRHKNVIHAKAMILSDFLIKPKKFYPCHYCAIPCFLKENNLSLRKFIIKKFF